jgi:hypothetical protein
MTIQSQCYKGKKSISKCYYYTLVLKFRERVHMDFPKFSVGPFQGLQKKEGRVLLFVFYIKMFSFTTPPPPPPPLGTYI